MLGKGSRLRDRVIPEASNFRTDDEITATPLSFIFFPASVYIDILSCWHVKEFWIIYAPC
jgi:hypothetical protein